MQRYRLQVVIEQDEDGYFVVEAPALQGCYAQGKTYDEAMSNIREVIAMCVQEMREDGLTVDTQYPEVIGIETVEIGV